MRRILVVASVLAVAAKANYPAMIQRLGLDKLPPPPPPMPPGFGLPPGMDGGGKGRGGPPAVRPAPKPPAPAPPGQLL